MADDPARHEPAVADSDHPEPLPIDERETAERFVDAHHEIGEVAATPVTDRRATELFAITLASARVHVDQPVAGGCLDLGFMPVTIRELSVRSTVDPKQGRVALRGIEGDRLHHPDVDIEPGAVEAETFWGRNLDLRAPFPIEMRKLPLT